ncbi:MAG: alpha/beta hydrolase, partial [Bacteroidota bacterium]
MFRPTIITLLFLIAYQLNSNAQEYVVYKQVDTLQLRLKVFQAENRDKAVSAPAMVFFFGGGWSGRNLTQFEPHAKYFSQRGITCFIADYRVKKTNNTSPFESLKDAKSAIRFIRKNAAQFGIDP